MGGGPKLYTVDIETRPIEAYVWGLWDQNISLNQIKRASGILCFAAKEYGNDKVEFCAEWQKKGYDGMVQRLHEIYNDAHGVISYNGAGYDTKWIKAAFVQAGLPPTSPTVDIDLFRTVRKHFQFPSKKLAYVCQALGLDLKSDSGGMQTWIECVYPSSRQAGRDARAAMRFYNENDTRITEQLYEKLLPWIDNHVNVGLFVDEDEDDPVCTNCGSSELESRGFAYTSTRRYRRWRCKGCSKWLRSSRCESSTELRSA